MNRNRASSSLGANRHSAPLLGARMDIRVIREG